MFEQAFVEGVGRTRRPWTVVVSFMGQVGVVGVAVVLPLVYTEVLPRTQLVSLFFAPSPPPGRRAPQPVPAPKAGVKIPPREFDGRKLTEPGAVPEKVASIIDIEEPPLPYAGPGSEVGVVGGIDLPPEALSPAVRDALNSGAAARVAPPPPASKPPEEKIVRLRVGGVVRPPVPVYEPRPVYPQIARQARVSGVVHLEALIGTDGTVRGLQLVSGHPLLVQAAMEAVRTWRYTPTLLNGDPIEVVMLIDVSFTLSK
ncbi:MAG TPA: energy transducer TonB [Bryobacteraceae bacterium]|nr:energy transducer TonB [Bryobacteraceae bacterium]